MESFLAQTPPFTKFWGIAALACAFLISAGLVQAYSLIFSIPAVVEFGQFWRIFTAPFFLGRLDFNLITYAIFPLMLVRKFESQIAQNRPSVMVYAFTVSAIVVLTLSGLFHSFMTGVSMFIAFEWLYSQMRPNEIVNFMMVIPMKLQWLPFANLLVTALQGGSLKHGLIGCVAGHTAFFLLCILPPKLGYPAFRAPRLFEQLFDRGSERAYW
jgi:Derlin-2/3